jgi:aldehyde dehydrogenase family 7 protein A1
MVSSPSETFFHANFVAAAIVCQDADLSLALPSVFFGAIGTAGQRCTSTRRLYIHRSIAPSFMERLQGAYKSVKPGDPLVEGTLLGPMHTEQATKIHNEAVGALKNCGAEILAGSNPVFSTQEIIHAGRYLEHGFFVRPVLAVLPPNSSDEPTMLREIWNKETFAPILKVSVFDELEEAIMWNNSVPQGLSSSLWTKDVRNVGKWIGPGGSDCGIVNVSFT